MHTFPNRLLLILSLSLCQVVSKAQTHLWSYQECIDTAMQRNIQVGQSNISVASDKLAVYRAKGSQLPNLNFSANQNFNFGRSIDPYTNQYVQQTISSNNFGLSSNWTLFNGLQVRNTIRQNDINLNATELDLQKTKNDLQLNVTGAYLQVLLDYEQLDNLKLQLQNDSIQLDRTQKLLNGGKLTENDLLQSKAQVASDNLNIAQAQGNLDIAKLTLMQLMELPATDSFDIVKVPIDQPNLRDYGPPNQIFDAAQQLPEMQSAKLRTQSSEMGYKIAKGGLYPKLSLGGSLTTGYSSASKQTTTTSGTNIEQVGYLQNDPSSIVLAEVPYTNSVASKKPFGSQIKDNFSQQIGLTLSVPIFNNRQVKYNMELSKLNIESAKLNETAVALTLRKSIEQAYTDVRSAGKQYAAAKDQLAAVQSSYDNMKLKYNIGMATAIDLSVLKSNLTTSIAQEIQAKYTYVFKAMLLDFYLGKPLVINAQQ